MPIMAALDAKYANLFGTPFIEEATEAMLIIESPPFSIILGSAYLIELNIAVTFNSNENT